MSLWQQRDSWVPPHSPLLIHGHSPDDTVGEVGMQHCVTTCQTPAPCGEQDVGSRQASYRQCLQKGLRQGEVLCPQMARVWRPRAGPGHATGSPPVPQARVARLEMGKELSMGQSSHRPNYDRGQGMRRQKVALYTITQSSACSACFPFKGQRPSL